MKAISLGMIKGRIDQVEEKVTVEWIQPRILNLSQIGRLRARVGEWKERADAMLRLMMNETSDWLVPV
jgi:26S proteasome regulatory subunit N9